MPDPAASRPTSPGWYWMLGSGDSRWIIVRVVEMRGSLCANDPHLDHKHAVPLDDPFWGVVEWAGPITPGDVAELARLQAAGDVLVDAAKRTTLGLDGTDHEAVRGQLCDAIAGWLRARMGGDKSEGSPRE